MPCLVGLIGFFFPRLVMIALLILTRWFSRSFDGFLWPLLGFLFLPYTTLAYMITMVCNDHHLSGGYVILVFIAVLLDLGIHKQSAATGKKFKRA